MTTSDMQGKVCLVTGSSSGIGKVTASSLARMGATVVMVCRNRAKGEAVQAEIKETSGNVRVDLIVADLSELSQVRRAASEFKQRCAVRHNFRITKKSALILEKRRAVMPPGLPLQAVGMILQANIDFLKIDRIEVTFLKIARIFLNQDVPRHDLMGKYMCKEQKCPQPQFRKIRSKIRKEAGIRTNFRKRALQENISQCC